MPSETPPMTRISTKYEDIPPRFRKVWIKGHAEKIQKKLDEPIDGFSTPMQQSKSDTNLSENETRGSRSHSVGASGQASSSSIPTPLHKRPRTTESSSSEIVRTRSGEGGSLEKENDASSVPIAYSGPSSIRQIVESVVNANVARSSPSASRSNSPLGDLNPYNRYRRASRSRPVTRTSSPASGVRSSTPTPSGWVPLTSRHSLRRFDIRPCGPRHLEYDYNEARKEFQGAAYYALGQYGYEPPKGVAKYKPPPPEQLPSMSDLRKIPDFAKACKRLDAADRALEEALARGETWENTPIPKEYLQFSLEDVLPEEFCVQRPSNASIQERNRSSVTLEEAAGQLKSSLLDHSSTTAPSVPTSASPSEGGTESEPGDEIQASHRVSSFAHTTLSDDQPQPPTSSSTPQTSVATSIVNASLEESQAGSSALDSDLRPSSDTIHTDMPQLQPGRKRLHNEIENDDESGDQTSKDKPRDVTELPTRPNSPTPPLATAGNLGSLGRTESESTSGTGSGSGEGTSARESPPTSISNDISKTTGSEGSGRARGRGRGRGRGGRVARMRGRGRATGSR